MSGLAIDNRFDTVAGGGDDLTVINLGRINSNDTAILTDDDADVANGSDGIISSRDGFGSDAGDDLIVGNSCLIDTSDYAILVDDDAQIKNSGKLFSLNEGGIDADDDLTVTNSGIIDANADAINGDDDAQITNEESGEIYSVSADGIDGGADLTVTNRGLIDAGDEGIEAGLRAMITNTAMGKVFGSGGDGMQVQGNAEIVNSGLIQSFQDDGIDIDSGSIRNTADGIIRSLGKASGAAGIDVDAIPEDDLPDVTDSSLEINNRGLIIGRTGILVNDGKSATQDVRNSGGIVGVFGVAMDLGAGEDILAMIGDGFVTGAALFGDGDDLLDLSMFGGGVVGGRDAFFDGGSENIADVIDLGAGVRLEDIFVFDHRDPGRIRLGYRGPAGSSTVFFTDFEQIDLDGDSYAIGDLSGIAPVPLPPALSLMVLGLGSFAVLRRRRCTS